MSTLKVNRWRVYCSTEGKYVDGYNNEIDGEPSTCFNNNTHTITSSKTKLIEIIVNDYTKTVVKWKVYCDDEAAYIEGYLNDDVGVPTKCFNNDGHTISGTPEKLEIIRNSQVKINENSRPVTGHLRIETIKLSLTPGQVLVYDKTWPINIAPMSVKLLSSSIHVGDTLTVDVSPDKIIGGITQDISIGDTIINVDPTVMEHSSIGYLCSITDGVTTDDLGVISQKDYVNSTITVQTATVSVFLASSPTYFRITPRFLGPHEFSDNGGDLIFGATKIGASHVPKNEIVRLTYTNNSKNYKDLYILLEYLY